MLRSDLIGLRTVQERDLEPLLSSLNNLEFRGAHFPIGLQSEAKLGKEFQENWFWEPDEGMLLIVTLRHVIGEIEFFPIIHYLVGYELSLPGCLKLTPFFIAGTQVPAVQRGHRMIP